MKCLPSRISKIDESTIMDHSYLNLNDNVYYLGEYTARKGFSHSDTNHVIYNLKKPMDRRGKPEWKFKQRAIAEGSRAISAALSSVLDNITFVPVPPSKNKMNNLYDSRILNILEGVSRNHPIEFKELIVQEGDRQAAHENDIRPDADDLYSMYRYGYDSIQRVKQYVAIFDDVITTGASFKAMQRRLMEWYPDTRIIGIYLARRVPEADDFSAFFDVQ